MVSWTNSVRNTAQICVCVPSSVQDRNVDKVEPFKINQCRQDVQLSTVSEWTCVEIFIVMKWILVSRSLCLWIVVWQVLNDHLCDDVDSCCHGLCANLCNYPSIHPASQACTSLVKSPCDNDWHILCMIRSSHTCLIVQLPAACTFPGVVVVRCSSTDTGTVSVYLRNLFHWLWLAKLNPLQQRDNCRIVVVWFSAAQPAIVD